MDRQKEIEEIKIRVNAAVSYIEEAQKLIQMFESAPEPKEPETWDYLPLKQDPIFPFEWDCQSQSIRTELEKFIKRLEIADYCGRREFEVGKDNYHIQFHEGYSYVSFHKEVSFQEVNYFPTKEAAEKYLRICQNSNLL